VPDRGRPQIALLQLVAPGDHVSPRYGAKFLRPGDPLGGPLPTHWSRSQAHLAGARLNLDQKWSKVRRPDEMLTARLRPASHYPR
jgi:hypothetical protein